MQNEKDPELSKFWPLFLDSLFLLLSGGELVLKIKLLIDIITTFELPIIIKVKGLTNDRISLHRCQKRRSILMMISVFLTFAPYLNQRHLTQRSSWGRLMEASVWTILLPIQLIPQWQILIKICSQLKWRNKKKFFFEVFLIFWSNFDINFLKLIY